MKIGVVMDPIGGIKIKKDSTFAMLLAAQGRGWPLYYMELDDLFVRDGVPMSRRRGLEVKDDAAGWFTFTDESVSALEELDVILMRKDPPFNTEYIYATYVLELAQRRGVLVVNDPAGLRDVNEKMFINRFPECIAPTLVTRSITRIRTFLDEQGEIVVKPLDGMGGMLIYRLKADDPNINVILESLSGFGTRYVMAQRFLPAISEGDKRILLIDGEPYENALARVPKGGDFRGNLAAGGTGRGVPLSARDREICAAVSPVLREKGLLFVGLDVIGEYLTEINVTSPTCIRELEAIYGDDIAGRVMDAVALTRAAGA